jgi:hypothetical protein
MQTMKTYPYWKVLIGFALAPAIGGGIIGFSIYIGPPYIDVDVGQLVQLMGLVSLILLTTFFGTVYFIIPSSLLAVVYTFLKLQKNWKGYLLTTVMGGVCAALWSLLWFTPNTERSFTSLFSTDRLLEDWVRIFLLGAISSFVMACLVLPKKEQA